MSIGSGPRHTTYFWTGASTNVSDQTSFANSVAQSAVTAAQNAASAMQQVSLTPIPLPSFNFGQLNLAQYVAPDKPSLTVDNIQINNPPQKSALSSVDLSALNNLVAPEYTLDDSVDISIPISPVLVAPPLPGPTPSFEQVQMPEYTGGPLPAVPDLAELQIPDAPVLDFAQFDVSRPEFDLPQEHLYDNKLIADTKQLASDYLNNYLELDQDSVETRNRWRAMLSGGTGLPPAIEQALFDRAIGREDVSSEQAIKQAQGEWAARGFSLPGATLLAREGEVRRANRTERGRLNREITIQAHQQEIENLRFVVEQGVRLEGQRYEQFVRIVDAARGITTSAYEVSRQLISARIEILNAQLQIYQTDVQVFRERIQIELARLEAFRSLLEAERVRGEINQQRVQIYQAQLQGVLANVEVYKAEIEGANGLIRAQSAQMEMYKSGVDAYRAQWEGERIKFDAYNSRVSAEQAKVAVFESQVRAFGERVNAFRSQTDAARSKVDAQTSYNESMTRQYGLEVDAWRSEITARIEKVRADVAAFQARVQMHGSEVSGEEAKVRAQAQNSQLAFEQIRADIEIRVKQIDQQIEQLRLAEQLGLEALRNSAAVNSQLAASALSAVNVSSSISDSVSRSNGMSGSWSYNESLSGEI